MLIFIHQIARNSTRKTTLQSVKVVGGNSCRSSFLEAQIQPLLDASGQDLATVIAASDKTYNALNSFGIFKSVNVGLDVAPPGLFYSAAGPQDLDLVATVTLQQAKRFTARTGTDLGNGEGTGYANFVLRSLFGGAETLSFDASIGTRTRSSYLLNFTSPLLNSSIWRGELLAFTSSRRIPWAAHEQVLKGLSAKIRSPHVEAGYEAVLRTITSVNAGASDMVRTLAGDGIKTSLFWSMIHDKRNDMLMPSSGYYFKFGNEIGGLLGPEYGDKPFLKTTFESQVATGFSLGAGSSLSSDGSPIEKLFHQKKLAGGVADDIIMQYSLRGGLLYSYNGPSHFMDRFFLGGANDVRGFQLNAMGPRQDQDSLGGDVFVAQGASLLARIPGLARTNPLRFLAFVNGGSVLELDKNDIKGTLLEAATKPSIAAGFGLAYRHPVARFELNVTLPLIARESEGLRKGLQFGVGLSFL